MKHKTLLLWLMLLMGVMGAEAKEAYAYYEYDDCSLNFSYDDNKSYYSRSSDYIVYSLNSGSNTPAWNSRATSIEAVYFGNSFANYKPSTCYRWFDGMTNLEEVDGISYLNTSNVTRMDYMFRNCSKLTSLNLSTFNTQNVTTMYAMFDGCSKLTSLNVSGWSNTKVTEMALMFDGCSILTSLNLSNFKTPSAKTMSCMFLNCKKLTSINVSSFTTSNVTTFYRMFDGCNSLTSLDLSGFNAAKITRSDGINFFLNGCYALKTLKLSESLASCSYYTDYSCSGIGTTSSPCTLNYPTSVSLSSSFSTITADYVKWKGGYFKSSNMHGYAVFNNTMLSFYYNDNWSGSWYALNTGTNQPEWYSIASKVKSVGFTTTFENARPTSCYKWFYGMSNLTTFYGLGSLNTSKVTDMSYMFYRCTSLTQIPVGSFDTSNVTNMYTMFYGCSALTELNLSKFNLSKLTHSLLMMEGCSSLKTLTIPSTANRLSSDACNGVGTASNPCVLNYPSDFTLTKDATGDGWFKWKSGYFLDYKAYANLSSDKKTLTFYYDKNWPTRSGTKNYSLNTDYNEPEWLDYASYVTTVIFDPSFANARPTSCHKWFCGMTNLGIVSDMNYYLNASQVTRMSAMFENCKTIAYIHLTGFKTPKTQTFERMFNGCSKLILIDVSDFNTSNAQTHSYDEMFAGCSSLPDLDISNFVIPAPVQREDGYWQYAGYNMMNGCTALKKLTIPSTANNLYSSACEGVGTTSEPCKLVYPSGFTPTKNETGDGWYKWKDGYFYDDNLKSAYAFLSSDSKSLTFYYDTNRYSRTGGTVYALNTGTYIPAWYSKRSFITHVTFHYSFANASPTSCFKWFEGMESLKSISGMASYFNTSQVTNMASMFEGCNTIENINVTGFNTAQVQTFEKMFKGCSKLAEINVSSFNINISNTQTYCFNEMFADCSSLTSLDISNFVIPDPVQLTDGWWLMEGGKMMKGCTALKKLTIPSTANNLFLTACEGVGTQAAPCTLIYPSGFTPQKSDSGNGWYKWKDGYFKDESQPSQFALGDVNHDGSVSVVDATLVTEYVLGKNPPVFFIENADVSHDGDVTVTDVSKIIEMVLTGSASIAPSTARESIGKSGQ